MTIYVTSPVKPHHRGWLEAAAGEHSVCYAADGQNRLTDAEVIIGAVGPAELAQAQNLRWFHLVWAGTDRFRPEHVPANVRFTNGSGAYGVMIAEHMMACMLSMVRHLPHYAAKQTAHQWDPNWQENTLEGKTVLILGTGMCLCLVWQQFVWGTLVGLLGIVMLIMLIPMIKGIK